MVRIKGFLGLITISVLLIGSTVSLIDYLLGGDSYLALRGTSIPIACILWPLLIGFGIILIIDLRRGAL